MVGLFNYPKRRLKKLAKNGEYNEALEFGRSLEKQFSQDPDFLFIMGSIYFIVDEPSKALPYFERSLEIDGTDVETLMLKTNSHLALQQKDEAIECCKKILAIDSKNKEADEMLEKLKEI
jgi:tetratricopeptide (TPR) repeat protein